MRTSNELYKAHRQIISECKENICRELERIGRTELVFDDPFTIMVSQGWNDNYLIHEEITSIAITDRGNILYLWADDCEIEPTDVIESEWLYIWQMVEEECRNLPTTYYTEIAHHDKKNNRFIYDLWDEIEETGVTGEGQAKEQMIYNYNEYILDNMPLDFLPVFFLCTRENGEYKRKYAVLSNSVATGMGYTDKELHDLKKHLNKPVICA